MDLVVWRYRWDEILILDYFRHLAFFRSHGLRESVNHAFDNKSINLDWGIVTEHYIRLVWYDRIAW